MTELDLHVPLPDPDDLDLAQATHAGIAMRDRRVAIMACQSLLAHSEDEESQIFIDQMELKALLGQVFNYSIRLQARIAMLQPPVSADRMPMEFSDEQGQDEKWVKARAKCFLTPDSPFFVHGPVALCHTAELAMRLLKEGDRLILLERVNFRKEVTHQIVIVVWEGSLNRPPPHLDIDRPSSCFMGNFRTEFGRELAFTAVLDLQHPVTAQADFHPLVHWINEQKPAWTGNGLSFPIRNASWPPAGRLIQGSESVFAMIELLVSVFSLSVSCDSHVYLFSSIVAQPIPDDFFNWMQSGVCLEMEANWSHPRKIEGLGVFVSGRYHFIPEETGWRKALLVRLDSHLAI